MTLIPQKNASYTARGKIQHRNFAKLKETKKIGKPNTFHDS